MSVETIHKVILHPFIKESIASLSTMTSLQGKAGDAFEDNVEGFRFKGYAICSQMQGELEGVILMHHYEETALEIGAQVFTGLAGEKAADTGKMNQDLSSALAEWGNTIIGRATDKLAKHNLSFRFSAPEMVLNLDDMEKFLKDVVTIITVPVHIDNVGRYFFNLLIRKANADTAIESLMSTDEAALPKIKSLATPLAKEENILLADDSPLIRKALRRYLGKMGYNNISEAGDGDEAVEKITADSPAFVFMDIVMNKMNGDDALAKIRETNKEVPIVMLTSVTDSAVIDKCTALGIQGFVLKPLNADTASDVLSHCLGLK
ncbi:MAG: response regulator [Proteobacteria bacterium]|nr:MAG: response regulator [Pseudomonadota bacterium]QKK12171.1 MAG: response regulator [Pseudomonadota bacterium]